MENLTTPENFYFHMKEAEPFLHIQLPIQLVKEKPFSTVSDSAKILYGLLLNRVSLSRKNGWIDENGRIYIIYSIKEIMLDMGISKRTAIRYLSQLTNIDNTGYGLISKEQKTPVSTDSYTGHFSPNMIYVHNFVSVLEALYSTGKWEEDDKTLENTRFFTECQNWHSGSAKSDTHRVPNLTPDECQDCHPIYNYNNNTYDSNNYPPTMQQNQGGVGRGETSQQKKALFLDLDDGTLYPVSSLKEYMTREELRELLTYPHFKEEVEMFHLSQAERKDRAIEELKYLIDYDYLSVIRQNETKEIDSLLEYMSDIITFQEMVTFQGKYYEPEIMCRQFFRLNCFCIEYVLDEFRKIAEDRGVKIPRKLYIKLLMSAPSQADVDLSATVTYDMAHWNDDK